MQEEAGLAIKKQKFSSTEKNLVQRLIRIRLDKNRPETQQRDALPNISPDARAAEPQRVRFDNLGPKSSTPQNVSRK